MKKLLLITFLLFVTVSFAQQNDRNAVVKNNTSQKTIAKVSAYPNPLVVQTKIIFQSKRPQKIVFSVKNLLGRTVHHRLINAKEGYNSLLFSRNKLQKGMYIYTLQTSGEIVSKRLVVK